MDRFETVYCYHDAELFILRDVPFGRAIRLPVREEPAVIDYSKVPVEEILCRKIKTVDLPIHIYKLNEYDPPIFCACKEEDRRKLRKEILTGAFWK